MAVVWYPKKLTIVQAKEYADYQFGVEATFTPASNLPSTQETVKVDLKFYYRRTGGNATAAFNHQKIWLYHYGRNNEELKAFNVVVSGTNTLNRVVQFATDSYTRASGLPGVVTKLTTVDEASDPYPASTISLGTPAVDVPARAMSVPPPITNTTATAIKTGNDVTGVKLNFTPPVSTGGAPVTNLLVYRFDRNETFTLIANLIPTANTYTDTFPSHQLLDRSVAYMVVAWNSAGASVGNNTTTPSIRTAPSAPIITSFNRVSNSTTINLKWSHSQIPYPGVAYDLYVNGVKRVLGMVGTREITVDDPSYNTALSVYLVARDETNVNTPVSGNSNVVNIPAPTTANKPTSLTPNATVVEVANDGTLVGKLAWVHNPADTSIHMGSYLEINDGTTTRYITVPAGATEYALPALYFQSSTTGVITYRVRTKGVNGVWSVYSDYASFDLGYHPLINITNPINNGILDSSIATIKWNYSQKHNKAQTRFEIQIVDLAGVEGQVATFSGTGTNTEYTPNYKFRHGRFYTIGLRVYSNQGIASNDALIRFEVIYPIPLEPELTGTFNEETGFTELVINNPTPTNPAQTVVLTQLYRTLDVSQTEENIDWTKWTVVNDPANVGEFIYDPFCRTRGKTLYLAVVSNEVGGISMTLIEVDSYSSRVWLNSGNDYMVAVSIPFNIKISENKDRINNEIIPLDGRSRPVSISGRTQLHTLDVGGRFDPEEQKGSTWQEFQDYLDRIDPHYLYRDLDGRLLHVSPPSVTMTRGKKNLRDVTINVTEVDYIDPLTSARWGLGQGSGAGA